ncbi:box C/D snoRNA protein 1 [Canna indica]|uniref:Box C/D snoRNA protein 1 n=1 Tax=Canna indica TaxID=4628 RepID=A0AAQ3Q9F7_9LILI|nr:box C/D snoRNA protein 1 [Canna indica]
MGEPEARPKTNPEKPSSCEECGSNPWKYRCPGCSICTCSLPCVKAHKERTSCTGKRSRTEFVPLPQFDDNLLLSDYNLLEETKRVAESAHRAIVDFGSNIRFQLPMRYRMLRNAAYRRKTRLLVLPLGMTKREKNQSRYNQRKNCVYWTVEWRFHSTDIVLMDHGVDEHVNLSTIIEKHLAPSPWNNQLRPFFNTNLDDLKFFIRKNAKGPKSLYRKLNIRAPIAQQLENTVIVEYPVIYVYLPSQSFDFEVEEVKLFVKKENSPSSGCDISSPTPKGTLFREEEIEEGELPSHTKVLDLTDCTISDPSHQLHTNKVDAICAKEDTYRDKKMLALVTKSVNPCSTEKDQATREETNAQLDAGIMPMRLSEDDKFNFEQEVKDAYSDLIGEIDPDDFLCLDDGFFFGDQDLEEGEIPN